MRDDFSEDTKKVVASRVGNCCSNPENAGPFRLFVNLLSQFPHKTK